MSEEGRFTIHLEQLEDYEFKVRFDWEQVDEVLMDEPPPLGARQGPNASRMLAAAVGNCLSASLMYCLARADVPPHSVKTQVTCKIVRNQRKRLRVGGLEVRIAVDEAISETGRLKRCLELFEDFCVVTASIREGIPVEVTVTDAQGDPLSATQG
jgi:organic hydroperoxide reductase OsmC/OhrA